MNKFIGIGVIFLFLLQFSFFPFIGIKINLILALVLILAQYRFDFSGIVWIFFCGILFDLFSAHSFGVNTLSFVGLSLLINFVSGFFITFENNWFINSVVYFVGKIIFDVMRYYSGAFFLLISFSEVNAISSPELFSFGYIFNSIIFAVATVIILSFYKKLEKISGEKRQELIINKKQ